MELPNLQNEKILSLDIETKDPDLKKLGPGVRRRKDNYICGVALATKEKEWYFPLKHPESNNLPEDKFFKWLKQYEDKTFILHNALYDLDWLQYQNFKPTKIIDTFGAEKLIDENQFKYDLSSVGHKYLKQKKVDLDVNKLWDMPIEQVSPYAKQDVRLTFDIWQCQQSIIESQQLMQIFDIEMRLIPCLLYMRKVGVRIDVQNLEFLEEKYNRLVNEYQQKVNEIAGCALNTGSNLQMKKAYDNLGYKYNWGDPSRKTGKVQPTFDKEHLELYNDPLSRVILEFRRYQTTYNLFIKALPKYLVGDRIHCLFNPFGTVSGRLTAKKPNLQQIPKRVNPEIKKDLRELFLSNTNKELGDCDLSQIELRILAHLARGYGAQDFRDLYNNDPDADVHQWCADLAGIDRDSAKAINFGLIFGMGAKKLCSSLGLSEKEGYSLQNKYHAKLPFLKKTMQDASNIADKRGYIRTILKRRRRFPWVTFYKCGKLHKSKFLHKALNALTQGSGADVIKKSMVDAWESGVFEVLDPHLTVHDELLYSQNINSKEAIEAVKELKYIMENCVKFKVPLKTVPEHGPNWANMKEMLV